MLSTVGWVLDEKIFVTTAFPRFFSLKKSNPGLLGFVIILIFDLIDSWLY